MTGFQNSYQKYGIDATVVQFDRDKFAEDKLLKHDMLCKVYKLMVNLMKMQRKVTVDYSFIQYIVSTENLAKIHRKKSVVQSFLALMLS